MSGPGSFACRSAPSPRFVSRLTLSRGQQLRRGNLLVVFALAGGGVAALAKAGNRRTPPAAEVEHGVSAPRLFLASFP
eukprot:CAMPEP_0183325368 /NCGR_PEP_ID=MMETSP0160_2-20130417/79376_1 /TAXON_ID=2839 ORGANISM="Odontella Sinensis, Strain Grunow 1884" /NCGR_SAMPLE_ID=MMETSP0160_2 /ASSEMBLY_ACC=CAM_ASM_000250 /LENGTH=77 /DNA_ID=CAMNT_0025493133 /DNA_START=221 /DNA_END=451 /DNA_ORIENTATION=+